MIRCKMLRRTAPLLLAFVLSGCGAPADVAPMTDYKAMLAQMKARNAVDAQNCPWPAGTGYHHPVEVNEAGAPPSSIKGLLPIWVDGCATVAFAVDPDGNVVAPHVLGALPMAVGTLALQQLPQHHFAPGAAPADSFVLRLSFHTEPNGTRSITTVYR